MPIKVAFFFLFFSSTLLFRCLQGTLVVFVFLNFYFFYDYFLNKDEILWHNNRNKVEILLNKRQDKKTKRKN